MKKTAKMVAALATLALVASFAPLVLANSTDVSVSPAKIAVGGTVTITLSFTGTAGETDTVNNLVVCPGGSNLGCGTLTTYSFTGTLPSFTCGSSSCTGTWSAQYPSGAVTACTISSGTGNSCTGPAGTASWSAGASTSTAGSYGIVALYTASGTQTGSFSADNGFSTPEFGLGIGAVLAVGFVAVFALRKRSLGSLTTPAV